MSLLDLRSSATPSAPYKGVTTSDVTVDQTRNLWFRLFVPSTTSSPRLFTRRRFLPRRRLQLPQPRLLRLRRRLPQIRPPNPRRRSLRQLPPLPEHGYPCQYDDGLDVLKFLDQNPDSLPDLADRSRCFLAGDSAGANIAHHVAVRACLEPFLRVVKPVGLISIQPFFGGEERTESEIRLEGAPLVSVTRNRLAVEGVLASRVDPGPRGGERGRAERGGHYGSGVPGYGCVRWGLDPLQDWQRRYCEWLRKSGKEAKLIEYPSMVHAFYVFSELPESNQLFSQVKDFVASIG
ncbi:hypothetical protein J5N97_000404 [Dioscorea zingiberensis]|uniref:Alpha/beta hydrolase fold-3 domain-containing protein n=1 Tax=Dioscorea zingiberensis TaxID=325984 RepID=A0A9D5H1L0_9LILI|nr:hypothetical protein J5N97_000404 [Dioscorea zingiberensis]